MMQIISSIILSIQDTVYIKQPIKIIEINESSAWWEYLKQPNYIMAMVAIVISIIALRSSNRYNRNTLKLSKIHNVLTVKPIMVSRISFDLNLKVTLENNGSGPAMLKKVFYNYKDYKADSISELIDKLNDLKTFREPLQFNMKDDTRIGVDFCVAEKSELILFKAIINTSKSPNYRGWKFFFNEMIVNVIYTDIYDNEYIK